MQTILDHHNFVSITQRDALSMHIPFYCSLCGKLQNNNNNFL